MATKEPNAQCCPGPGDPGPEGPCQSGRGRLGLGPPSNLLDGGEQPKGKGNVEVSPS
jgi:hypothetical protein